MASGRIQADLSGRDHSSAVRVDPDGEVGAGKVGRPEFGGLTARQADGHLVAAAAGVAIQHRDDHTGGVGDQAVRTESHLAA